MRIALPILLIFLAPTGAAQEGQSVCEDPSSILRPYIQEEQDGSIKKILPVPEGVILGNKALQELAKQGIIVTRVPGCRADYSDIEAEERESDARRRAMRDTVIPLKDQYEQELYYKDRRAKRYEEMCGKTTIAIDSSEAIDLKFQPLIPERVDMTRKACKAIGVVCKPVKHW